VIETKNAKTRLVESENELDSDRKIDKDAGMSRKEGVIETKNAKTRLVESENELDSDRKIDKDAGMSRKEGVIRTKNAKTKLIESEYKPSLQKIKEPHGGPPKIKYTNNKKPHRNS